MLLTEEEAKTKQCPEIARALAIFNSVVTPQPPFGDGRSSFAVPSGPVMAIADTCIGSSCMAWRWGQQQPYENGLPLPEGTTPADPGWEKDGEPYIAQTYTDRPARWDQRWRRSLPRRGFCGKVFGCVPVYHD